MVQLLNNYTGLILLFLCALLLLCSALLFMLIKRQNQTMKKAKEQIQATGNHVSNTAATLEGRLRDELNRLQGIILSAIAESSRDQSQRIDALGGRMDAFGQAQENRLHRIAATLDEKLTANDHRTEKLRETLSSGMEKLQKENAEKQLQKAKDAGFADAFIKEF